MLISRTFAQAAAICFLSLNPRLAVAQSPDHAKPCVPEKRALHASQRTSADMFATLLPSGDSADVPAMYLATLLQEIQLHFNAPDTIAELSSGQMGLWLHGDGRLSNPRASDALLSPELVRTLALAIDSTSRGGGIGPVFPQLRTDSVSLRLVVHYADQQTPPLSVPLLRVALPVAYFEFQVEKPAIAKRGNPAPKYPESMRETNFEGEVLAQFVVSRVGRAEMRTFRVLKASHEDFVIAVRDVLPRMRFYPAELGGCPVRQLAHLPFAFKLNR